MALPCLQLIPAGRFASLLASDEIRQLRSAIGRLGVEPPATISIYPLATLRSWVVLAGCCAVFMLASGAATRFRRRWPWALAPLAAAGILEALLGIRQYLHARAEQTGTLLSAHGTFVNRDHFAVLLEACLGMAIGLALAGFQRTRRKGWLGSGGALCLGGIGLAALSLSGIVLSSSRAGIAIGALLMTLGLIAAVVCAGRGKSVRRAAAALAIAAVALAVLQTALPANVTERFAALWESRGDPVRLAIWADSWSTARAYPWAGSGLGTFGSAFQRSFLYAPRAHVDHAHSDYLEWLVELGFPATLLLLGVIGAGIWISLRNIRRVPDAGERWLRGGCLLGATAILLHAAVDFPLRIPALAMAFATLAGFAYGAGPDPAGARSSGSGALRAAASGGLLAAMAGLAVWTGFGNTEPYDADTLFARAEEAVIRGERERAETLYWDASRANPFAAGVWLKRAELAGVAGDGDAPASFLDLARRLEPFTLRTEWPLVQRWLRDGRFAEAAPRLARIAAAMSAMRPGIYASALGAGMAAVHIARQIVPPESDARDEFVRFLLERRCWDGIAEAVRALRECGTYSPRPGTLQLVLDGLFAAGETSGMAVLVETLAAGPARGTAFPWLVRAVDGVTVRIDSRPAEPVIEIDFQSPGNIAYGNVYRYFAVVPGRQYGLEAEVRTDRLGGVEPVRIAVRAPARTLAVSPGLRGSEPWHTVRVALAIGATERMIRVEIMRPRGILADDAISGRLYLKNVRLIERGGPGT